MMKKKTAKTKKRAGILLDIGCGENKKGPTWVGMDKRPMKGVDIVHDLEVFPWPIKDESVLTTAASHILEHIKPWFTLDVFNEVWRITVPGGQFAISLPYGVGPKFVQDPTHCNPFNEITFLYFDPEPYGEKGHAAWRQYKPRPWRIKDIYWQDNGFLEVLLEKRPLTDIPEDDR